ncbi:MAG: right-handed parallel beta-helix repeat-containing protein [Saprospiraceae bacterium]|nr:right-handed parallel beta-helix repeat-containing protein [Saprospiraceae bacterium]MCF8252631.1 right-handed parallel beta-helix repeat-containing protein [Saprospiraceae bacterium]MCF8314198.1 right-handed parallel beta-helix repeat-containing protein [Saprospiraceae bacterium]MCF8442998.1 right-handed parallel beta-helix repeat-containing protein [Saprospiraceae bacterium]
MKKVTFFIAFIFTLNNLSAVTWYVAPNGNDNNSGSLASPFKTIPAAIEAASPGDIIELRNGNYVSNEIRVTKSNLTIRSYAGEWAVITAPTNVEDIASCIWYNEPDVVGGTLERLEIVGGYYYGVSFETNWDWGEPTRNGASNITIRNCKIHDTGRDCIKIKPACNNIQILSCELYNSGVGISNSVANGGPNAEGIDNVNGDGMVVRNCYIHDISTSGVYVKGGVKDCFIEENLIYNVQEGGILLGFYTDAEYFDQDGTNPAFYECQYSLARNNIVYNTGGAGIGFFAARNCSAYNNTVVTASPQFHAPLYLSPGEIWIDDNTTLTPPNFNIQAYNNIFVDQSGTGDEDYTVQIREGGMSGTNLIDRNIYQKTNGTAKFDDGVSWPALTFSQWKSQMGFDANSQEANPKLDGNLHLQSSSPAIDAGQNSPAARDYDAQPRSGNFDIGADEYGNGTSLQVPPPNGTIGTGVDAALTPVRELLPEITVEVYPNPASEFIMVKTGDNYLTPTITLASLDGKRMKTVIGDKIIVSELPNGLYLLTVSINGGVASMPIIIHH